MLRTRYITTVLILILTLTALHSIYPRFMAGIYTLRADHYLGEKYYGLNIEYLKKAADYLPNNYEIKKKLGSSYYAESELKTRATEKLPLVRRSLEYYESAVSLNPVEAESVFGLARAEFYMEGLNEILREKDAINPYNPLPWLKRAIDLRPNSSLFLYTLALYYYNHSRDDELFIFEQPVPIPIEHDLFDDPE